MAGTEDKTPDVETEKKYSPELEKMIEDLKVLETDKPATTELAVFRNQIARKYMSEGALVEAMDQFSNALDINKASDEPDLGSMVESLRGIGDIHLLVGDVVESLKAKVCACEILDDLLPMDPLTADVYREIALIYSMVNRNNDAIAHYLKAAEILEKNGCKNEPIGSVYANLSTLFGKTGDRKNKSVYSLRAERAKRSQ